MKLPIVIAPEPERGTYRLYAPAVYETSEGKVTVPGGFETDGASIPRFAWLTTGTPFDPRHIRAAVAHDHMYRVNGVTRLEADKIFRAILLEDGVAPYQAWKMFLALRVGGWVAWRRYRRGERRK